MLTNRKVQLVDASSFWLGDKRREFTLERGQDILVRILEEIEADIRAVEADIVRMLAEVTGGSRSPDG